VFFGIFVGVVQQAQAFQEMAKNVQNSHFSFARIFIFNGKYAVTKFATS
jgi:hypothetical protein